ncbi:hypothetical protein JW968_03470 [Candidatus Woesearchaeota archaeon]|nr:hypothetical protein [Candidatus Woesearchaeota archaeon]
MKKILALAIVGLLSLMLVPTALAAVQQPGCTPGVFYPWLQRMSSPMNMLWGYFNGGTPLATYFGVSWHYNDANVPGEDVKADPSDHIYYKGKYSQQYKRYPLIYQDVKEFVVKANGPAGERYTFTWNKYGFDPFTKYELICGNQVYNMKKMDTLHLNMPGDGDLKCKIRVSATPYGETAWPGYI